MPDKAKKNPVEERLMLLADHWIAFRENPAKRLLVWQAEANALRFFQCFFEVQKHETDYTVGDMFVVFDTPFENVIQYSRDLKTALKGQYDASRDDLIQQGITPDWHFSPENYPDSVSGFIRSLQSFGSRHHERIGHLVAVFMPSEVSDDEGFTTWLNCAMQTRPPERLRFAVMDPLDASRLASLNGTAKNLIQIDRPKIDALSTAQETFAQESATGPAGVFRNLLIGLMTLVEKGTAKQVKIKAADALQFARKEKWVDQEVVIGMLVAGAMLKEKRFDEAVKGYQFARQKAQQATADAHPAGRQLALQTWFGEAGAHLAAGDLPKAVQCYDEAATLAPQIPNPILGIEAFRMAAFCLGRMDEPEPAIRKGLQALNLGQRLKPEARAMTTLPVAAIDMLRLMELKRVQAMEHIKYQHNTAVDTSRKKATQQALELEQNKDPQALHAVEANLEEEISHAKQAACRDIDTLAATGDNHFQQVFTKARELLGSQWPMETLNAVAQNDQTTGDMAS
ncbi:hypothetical protein [uncultured Desulfobacter sp.]|uniref:hypothetical protein n=1 Tax=uncultured Desulfobacter sp. TaxID=240139 RepID=UPI002AA74516|nr:hypothetical protein [uncultured Desulfobacter sp.]